MNSIPSPIRVTAQFPAPQCLACSAAAREVVLTTDAVSHTRECHPEAMTVVEAQFAPRHTKIVRTAH